MKHGDAARMQEGSDSDAGTSDGNMSDSDTSMHSGPVGGISCGSTLGMDTDTALPAPPKPKPAQCWMCTFCKTRLAMDMTSFIVEHTANMAMPHITEQVREQIMLAHPDAKGAHRRDIERHIQHHVVSPEVKMANIIRSLSGVGETVRLSMTRSDPETGDLMLDNKQVELYLKIMAQLQSTYRTDAKKMLFHA
jgi:hypothetical protein